MHVAYNPGSLDPGNDNWIHSDLDPIPIGVVHGNITSSFIDPRIQHRINVWLYETTGGGEGSQIARNDGLLKTVMCIAGITHFLRNKRPDFTALYGGVPLLIDEEKEGDDIKGAMDDIINNFSWIPNLRRLPFFIGIAFSFNQVRIVRLVRNAPMELLFSHALGSLEDRLAVLQPAVNVARVLKYFVDSDMITPAGLSMGNWHKRACGKDIKISLQGVEVKCIENKFKYLKAFYSACRNVAYLERLTDAVSEKNKLVLGPLGLAVKPTTDTQFRQAVKCVATALFGIHQHGYVHTDVRWSNIVLLDNDDWMLIDCYEVCKLADEDGLRARATARGLSVQFWSCGDDISQLVRLGTELSFSQKEFTNDFETLVASGGATLAAILALCDA
jgi:hypothetical protein